MRYYYTNNMRTLLAFLSLYQHLIKANESVNQHSFEVWRLLAESEIEHSNAVRMLQGRLFDSFRYYNLYERFLAFAVKEWNVLRALYILIYSHVYLCGSISSIYRWWYKGGGLYNPSSSTNKNSKKMYKTCYQGNGFSPEPADVPQRSLRNRKWILQAFLWQIRGR